MCLLTGGTVGPHWKNILSDFNNDWWMFLGPRQGFFFSMDRPECAVLVKKFRYCEPNLRAVLILAGLHYCLVQYFLEFNFDIIIHYQNIRNLYFLNLCIAVFLISTPIADTINFNVLIYRAYQKKWTVWNCANLWAIILCFE